MLDRREAILAQLEVIFGTLGASVGRNRGPNSEDALPAIILHDGVEQAEDLHGAPRGSVVDMVKMEPQIFVLVTGPAKAIGTTINALRASLLHAVLTDATLKAAITSNGQIRYVGCTLTTEAGEGREADMEIKLSFQYPFLISELQ